MHATTTRKLRRDCHSVRNDVDFGPCLLHLGFCRNLRNPCGQGEHPPWTRVTVPSGMAGGKRVRTEEDCGGRGVAPSPGHGRRRRLGPCQRGPQETRGSGNIGNSQHPARTWNQSWAVVQSGSRGGSGLSRPDRRLAQGQLQWRGNRLDSPVPGLGSPLTGLRVARKRESSIPTFRLAETRTSEPPGDASGIPIPARWTAILPRAASLC